MLIAQVQFAPWDKVYNFSTGGLELSSGDYVIVKTELGTELGKIVKMLKDEVVGKEGREIKPILRKADYDDITKLPSPERKEEVMEFCREMIARHDLPMKLVDVHFAYENNRYNFAFISDSRVDFRELVKDLAGRFSANIRLTQIGTRDEAKITGDCGPCGRGLCCRGFLDEFSSITSEMAEAQQVVHRGSERISGMCGRLMCCLAYEYEGYKEMAGHLPPIGTKVNVDGARGVVIGQHILKQTVDVRIAGEKEGDRDTIISVDINRHKKKDCIDCQKHK
ncbi:MAG: regulatory iron-sulfur-containing complex subunit RicT [Patescibacteria group bacterium]|jgi:cell fate regulator YaaT (PSP1 superfamily)